MIDMESTKRVKLSKLCKSNIKLFTKKNYICPHADGYEKFSDLADETKLAKEYFIKMNELGFYTYDSQNGNIDKEFVECKIKEVLEHRKFAPNFSMQRAYVAGIMHRDNIKYLEKLFETNTDVPLHIADRKDDEWFKINRSELKEAKLIMHYSDGKVKTPKVNLTIDMIVENNKITKLFPFTTAHNEAEMYEIQVKEYRDMTDNVVVIFADTCWGRQDYLYEKIIEALKNIHRNKN